MSVSGVLANSCEKDRLKKNVRQKDLYIVLPIKVGTSHNYVCHFGRSFICSRKALEVPTNPCIFPDKLDISHILL